MAAREIRIAPAFDAWQAAARGLLFEGVSPDDVVWREVGRGDAPGSGAVAPSVPSGAVTNAVAGDEPAAASGASAPVIRVPRAFVDLARDVARHEDPARWGLLYDVLWRIVHEGRDVLAETSDDRLVRLHAMQGAVRATGAASFVPAGASLDELREAGRRCTGCELHRCATQMVFGKGPSEARVVLVGEQPGDQEDLQGAPFVGPAGEVLDRALAEAGLDRQRLYVTNVVKHFKFVPRGKRRIHQTPSPADVAACLPWLEAELSIIRPAVLVCLGATAARAIIGPEFRIMRDHGRVVETRLARRTTATLHPSAVLRGEDDAAKERLYRMLVDDLAAVARGS
jgi:uracil-DNA glycosylase